MHSFSYLAPCFPSYILHPTPYTLPHPTPYQSRTRVRRFDVSFIGFISFGRHPPIQQPLKRHCIQRLINLLGSTSTDWRSTVLHSADCFSIKTPLQRPDASSAIWKHHLQTLAVVITRNCRVCIAFETQLASESPTGSNRFLGLIEIVAANQISAVGFAFPVWPV